MRRRTYLGAAAIAAAAFGGMLDSPPDGMPGVSSAEAKDYYTRKRVNGRWITGHFPKASAGVRRLPKPPSVLRFSAAQGPKQRPAQAAIAARPEAEASPAPAAPEPLVAPPSDEPMLRLRAALEAHARTLATGSLLPPAADALPTQPVSPQPTGVAFDFQTGLKRTTFTDGSVLEEEFDIDTVRGQMSAQGKEQPAPGASAAR